jgi:hypothetical protein
MLPISNVLVREPKESAIARIFSVLVEFSSDENLAVPD